jgi:glycosyltransferase involved in cell wall biosynthesis
MDHTCSACGGAENADRGFKEWYQAADEIDHEVIFLPVVSERRDVSVVIATRNRAELVDRAIRETLKQQYTRGDWEIVVVDNGSSDDTVARGERYAQANPDRVRVFVEEQLGVSATRNRGFREAKHDILATIDDDAYPLENWLEELVKPFDDPEVECVGGRVMPDLEVDPPDWFLGRYLPFYSTWDLGEENTQVSYPETPRGANMAIHRKAVDRWGEFRTYLGRKGKSLISCEEPEMCLRIERGGGKVLYVPRARVKHFTEASRLRRDWIVRRHAAQGASDAVINWHHASMKGVLIGLRAYFLNWRRADYGETRADKVYTECQRQAFFGYLRGIPTALFRIPTFTPPRSGDQPKPWLPPS